MSIEKKYPKYSVLMSIYKKEKPEWFEIAIDSMLNQTIKPSEFVIICDGPLTPELDEVINKKCKTDIFKVVRLEKNQGLGPALNRGVLECSNEFIARMDSDDYCAPERIEKELEIFKKYPELSMVGTNVDEFEGDISNIISHVVLPETHESIYKFAKSRCPFRHPSLLYKKTAILSCGNYRKYHLCEDYDLYTRFLINGGKAYNIQSPLVYMRISSDFYKRRGGIKYLKSILKFKKEQLNNGFFSKKDYIKSSSAHIAVCLMPNFLREFVYKKFLRGKNNG